MRYIAAIALLGFLLPATAISAPAHCVGYNYEEFSSMAPAERIKWFTEEIAQCDDAPTQMNAYTNRGVAYYELGEFERALEDYNQAVVLVPNDPNALFGRVYTYYSLGRNEEAIADFDQALALDPSYVGAYSGRASAACLAAPPRTQSALEDILRLIEREPQWAIDWQAYLSTEGFYTGPVGGDFDEASQEAFRAWCDS